MKRLVILDRDGVINHDSPEFIKSVAEWQPIPGSLAAIALLNRAQVFVAIATNQSGIARGLLSEATLAAIHQKMVQQLLLHQGHIDKIFYCPHGPHDHCACRKPKPGLLLQAMDYFQVSATQTYFVGDAPRDIAAAVAAACHPILIHAGDHALLNAYPNLLTFAQTFIENKI